jgi:hypothetical protein
MTALTLNEPRHGVDEVERQLVAQLTGIALEELRPAGTADAVAGLVFGAQQPTPSDPERRRFRKVTVWVLLESLVRVPLLGEKQEPASAFRRQVGRPRLPTRAE